MGRRGDERRGRAGHGVGSGRALGGRGEVTGQTGSVLQLVIVQVELLGDFPPAGNVKEVVRSSLVGSRLLCWHHPRGSGDPDSLLFVIPEGNSQD